MPVIDTQPGSDRRGMTRDRIIELALARTRGAGKGTIELDLGAEFLVALQEFCGEARWYWRRKKVAFNTVAGTPTYDMGDYQAYDLEQIIDKPKLFVSATEYEELEPIFETDEQDAVAEDTAQDTPARYFIEPGTTQTIHLTPIPADTHRVVISYWAMPNTSSETQPDEIPLVPGFLHHIIQKGLEKNILRTAVGARGADYLAAKSAYEAAVARAALRTDFAQGRVHEWKASEEAIRSS